jgi:hypothetical protein
MKFAINQYNVNYPVVPGDKAPLPNAVIESHPFGMPPFEMRSVWVADINELAEIVRVISTGELVMEFSLSGYWSGSSLAEPRERLLGVGLYENLNTDPGRPPVRIVPKN